MHRRCLSFFYCQVASRQVSCGPKGLLAPTQASSQEGFAPPYQGLVEVIWMAKSATYLAFDFGAESGRAVIGELTGGKVSLREIHRFPTGGTILPTGMHWDVLGFLDRKSVV